MKILNSNFKIFIFLIIIIIVAFQQTKFSFADNKKVTIGFTQEETELNKSGIQIINQYTFDYLNEISKYTGYEYNYQLGTIEENIKKLENGEIDILCCCNNKIENNSNFTLTTYFFEWHNINIVIKDDGKPLTYKDYINLDGATVGVLQDAGYINYTDKFFKNLQVNVTYKSYKTKNDILLDLKNGNIDCGVVSFNKIDSETKTIASINTHKNSFIINSKNKKILDELNFAMEQIQSKDAGFASELLKKCYPQSQKILDGFTKKELDFITTNPKIKIAFNYTNKDYYKINDNDTEEVVNSIIDNLSNISGIQIELVDEKNNKDVITKAEQGEISAISLYSDLIDKSGEIKKYFDITKPYIKAPLVIVGTEKLNSESKNEPIVFAVHYDIPQVRDCIFRNYPNAIIRCTQNSTETLESIKNKTADAMVIESFIKESIDYRLEFPNLKYYSKTDITIPVSIAVAKTANPFIFSILDKSINIMDENQVEDIICSYLTTKQKDLDFLTIVKYYFPHIFQLLFVAILIILSIIVGYVYSVNKKLKSIVFTDSITGYINYYKFIEILKQHVKDKTACNYCIIYFDMQKFKYINTNFGYETGNTILKIIAYSLHLNLNSDECFARVYADNFVILINKNKGNVEKRLKQLAYKTRKEILNRFNYVNVTARCGVYAIQPQDNIASDIIDKANIARQVIGSNMNKFISYYDDEVRKNIFMEKEIEDNMNSALINGEFKVFIQPKNNIKNGKVCGGEALIRWISPKRGMIYPNDFIPVFEKNGFIVNIDMYVLETVCKFIYYWINKGYRIVPISVNLSRIHISNPNLVKNICEIVDKYNIPRSYIELELTESTDYDDMQQLIEVLKNLHNEGFLIAMDDFGKAYSSLNLLKEIPIDILKLDKDFITSCAGNSKGETIIKLILSMSKKLGLEVVCEGVETKVQVDFLTNIGCDVAQGYYFSKPMAVSNFEEIAFGNKKIEVMSSEH